MKQVISKEALLSYPDFSQPFDLHTDASHSQLGAAASQQNKPIDFFSIKLNPAQTRCTTTESNLLLGIVKTLK
jgi:RNase H-like domain found in reverse transcriptase